MLLNRVLQNVLSKHLRLAGVCHYGSPLITPYMEQIKSNIGFGGNQFYIHCWFADTLRAGLFFPEHSPDVDCCFLREREAPRCSWGKIYASGSRRNADSLGNQKISLLSLSSWNIDTIMTSLLSEYLGIPVTVSYQKAQTLFEICFFYGRENKLVKHLDKIINWKKLSF